MDRKGRNGGTLRSFEKGQSGNPAGRPRGRGLISQIMKELGDFSDLEFSVKVTDVNGQVTHQRMNYSTDGQNSLFALMAIQLIYQVLIRGNINAFKILLNRTEGRVPPPIRRITDHTDPIIDDRPPRTADQMRSELDQVRARIAQYS